MSSNTSNEQPSLIGGHAQYVKGAAGTTDPLPLPSLLFPLYSFLLPLISPPLNLEQ